jgi:hypothetical protein
LKRFVEKFVQGSARLAFWRKPVEAIPDQPQFPDPASDTGIMPNDAASNEAVDVPVQPAGWLARLRHALRRHKDPSPESPEDSNLASSPEQTASTLPLPGAPIDDASATAGDAPPPAPSFLARLKNTLRRQSRLDQAEVAVAAEKASAEIVENPIPASEDDSVGDTEGPPVNRIGRVLALLSNKWVWIPGTSVALLAIVATMVLMLLQARHEKAQLQADLIATQIKLKQASIGKQTAARQTISRQAEVQQDTVWQADAQVSTGSAAGGRTGEDTGNCDVSNKESVVQNLRNCIDEFNKITAR